MLRKLFLFFLLMTGVAIANPVVNQVHGQSSSVSVATYSPNVLATPSPGNQQILIEHIYTSAGQFVPTTPTGWSLAASCFANRDGFYVFTHLQSSGDPTSVTQTTTAAVYWNAAWFDVTSTSLTLDGTPSCSSNNGSTTSTTTAITPRAANELAIAVFGNAYQSAPTDTTGWTNANANGGAYLHYDYELVPNTSAISPSISFSTAPTFAQAMLMAFQLMPPGWQQEIALTGAGEDFPNGTVTATPSPTPSASPTPYIPPGQGAYLTSPLPNPSPSYPAPPAYSACQMYCPTIISGYAQSGASSEDPQGYYIYNIPHAKLEGVWNKCHISSGNNNGEACIMYGSFQFMDPKGYAGYKYQQYTMYHEGNFQHENDVLSLTPDNTKVIDNWESNYFGSYGYKLYNAINDAPIATLAGNTTTYTETGLTNGVPVYRYLDVVAVDVIVTTNIAAGSNVTITPVAANSPFTKGPGSNTTTPVMSNIQIHNGLELCNNGITPSYPIPSGCDEVIPNTINSTNFVVDSVANNHTCSSASPCRLYAEKAFSSINTLDNLYSDDHSLHMANSTDANEFGKRLSNIANQNGVTAPSAIPTSSPGTTVTGQKVSFSTNPRPGFTFVTPLGGVVYTAGSVNATITVNITGPTANTVPVFQYFRHAVTGSTSLSAPETWTTPTLTPSSQTISGNIHTWTATFSLGTPSNAFLYPFQFRVCDSSSIVCTYPFVGQQSENERVEGDDYSCSTYQCRMFIPSSPTFLNDISYLWDKQPGLSYSPPGANVNDEIRLDDGGPWVYTYGPFSYVTTPYVMQDNKIVNYGLGQQVYANSIVAGPSFTNHENSVGKRAQIEEIDQAGTIAGQQYVVSQGLKSDLYDSFFWSFGSLSWQDFGTFYTKVDKMNVDLVNNVDLDVNPVEQGRTGWANFRYDNFALYLLEWAPTESFRGQPDMHQYPEYYIPIGYPTNNLPSSLISPACDANPTGTSCDLAVSAGEWDASHQMFHRPFQQGDVWVCPPMAHLGNPAGYHQTACSAVTYGQNVYLLNINTANTTINNAGTRSYTLYTAGTALPTLTAGHTQIVMFNPY